jgi:hypothetical protein
VHGCIGVLHGGDVGGGDVGGGEVGGGDVGGGDDGSGGVGGGEGAQTGCTSRQLSGHELRSRVMRSTLSTGGAVQVQGLHGGRRGAYREEEKPRPAGCAERVAYPRNHLPKNPLVSVRTSTRVQRSM